MVVSFLEQALDLIDDSNALFDNDDSGLSQP